MKILERKRILSSIRNAIVESIEKKKKNLIEIRRMHERNLSRPKSLSLSLSRKVRRFPLRTRKLFRDRLSASIWYADLFHTRASDIENERHQISKARSLARSMRSSTKFSLFFRDSNPRTTVRNSFPNGFQRVGKMAATFYRALLA